MKIRQINDAVVTAVPSRREEDIRPVKGATLFPKVVPSNIFLSAQTNSGKTSVIYKIVKECIDKNTTVIAFVSTLFDDDSWLTIQEYCESKKIPFVGHTAIKENGEDHLQALVDSLHEESKQREIKEKEKKAKIPKAKRHSLFWEDSDEEEDDEDKPSKSKYQTPRYLIIFDDISDELKAVSFQTLLKKSRHFKARVIISSQYLKDLSPMSRKQIYYYLVFKGESNDKLEIILKDSGIPLSLDKFITVYKHATQKPYSFLYVSRTGQLRRNFTHIYETE